MRDETRSWQTLGTRLAWGCGGLAAGVCVMLVVATALLVQRVANPPASPDEPPAHSSLPPAATATPRPDARAEATPTADSFLQSLLERAEQELTYGSAQEAIDLLTPEIDRFVRPENKARACEYLAQAHARLGHYQFAAAYYDQLYTLAPTVEHLLWLAYAYDQSGDLEHALETYEALAHMTDPEADEYRALAEVRIEMLEAALGKGAAPTPEATPIGLATGTGRLTLGPHAYPLFSFAPVEPIRYARVESLTFRLQPVPKSSGAITLQLYPWAPEAGGWGLVELEWGDNPVRNPGHYVDAKGNILVGLRNWSTGTIEIENAGFVLVVEKTDGTLAEYGLGR